MLKKVLAAATLFSTFAYCNECQTPVQRFEQGHPVDKEQMLGAYNAPSRFDPCGCWDVFIEASLILWQPKEQGLSVANITPNGDVTQNNARILNMDIDFDPGFILSLGTAFSSDNWNLWAKYTRLHTKNKKNISVNTSEESLTNLFEVWEPLTDISRLNSTWKLYFDMLDLYLGRPYYVGTKLTFLPFLGLKAGSIKQRLHQTITDSPGGVPENYKNKFRSSSWLAGPMIGVNTNWLVGDGFRFFGNIASSIFYQHFSLTVQEYSTLLPDVITSAKNKDGIINPSLEFRLGFGWGSYIYKKKYHIDITAGYDFIIFWNQNRIRSFADELASGVNTEAGDLTPHGFSFAIRFDF